MKDYGIKPNYSALQREYGIDRHTIKKYYNNDGIPKRKNRKGAARIKIVQVKMREFPISNR